MAHLDKLSSSTTVVLILGTVAFFFTCVLVLTLVVRHRRRCHPSLVEPEEAGYHSPKNTEVAIRSLNDVDITCRSDGNNKEFAEHPCLAHVSLIEDPGGKCQSGLLGKSILGSNSAFFLRTLAAHQGQSFCLIVAPVHIETTVRAEAISQTTPDETKEIRRTIRSNTIFSPETEYPEIVDATDSGVNPWLVEYKANPVLFPHLATPAASPPPASPIRSRPSDDDNELPERVRKKREVRMAGSGFPPDSYVAEEFHMTVDLLNSTVNFESMESWSSEDTACSWASTAITAVDDDWKDMSPASTISEASKFNKGKKLLADLVSNDDLTDLDRMLVVEPEPTISEKLGPSCYNVPMYQDLQIACAKDLPIHSPTLVDMTSLKTSLPQVASKQTQPSELPYPCPMCSLQFRTPGLRKNHYNRKHNHRYKCSLCSIAFGLRADLERHKVTKHSGDFQHDASRTYRCPNIGCSTPLKEYFRRDNFRKHVKRCERACEKARKEDEKIEDV